MRRTDPKLKATVVLAALLSIPVVQGVLDGSIPSTTAAVRIGLAAVLAYGGVLLVVSVVGGYLPEPEPEEETPAEIEGVEDAVVVDELTRAADETEDAP